MPARAHKPTSASRKLVSALCVCGVPQARICVHVGISEPTLRKAYRKVLDLATERMVANATVDLVRLSKGKSNAAFQAVRMILACKGGWKDAMRLEIAAKGSGLPALLARVEQDDRERVEAGDQADDGILWQN